MRKVLGVAVLFAMSLMGADVSGKWSGSFMPNGEENSNSHPLYMMLNQDGDKLTGSGGPNESEQHPMQNGKVDGDHLTFEVPAGGGVFSFDLRIVGDEITGDLHYKGEKGDRTAKVSLKRAAA